MAAVASKKQTPKMDAKHIQGKFIRFLKKLDDTLIEREEENRLGLTSLLAQEHLLLVGDPGVAKSMMINFICGWFSDQEPVVVHCCKDTTRSMAFGPPSLKALKEDKQERNLAGGAADTPVLVLEEVFKAGPAVLDMFLLLMNERIYKEGVYFHKSPLRLLLGASNEWSPEGCEAALAAFFDRFLLRKEVFPISRSGEDKLVKRAIAGTLGDIDIDERTSIDEVDYAHRCAMALPWSEEAAKAFKEIRQALRDSDNGGIRPGNRRMGKGVKAVRAYAWLHGAVEVLPEHLEVLGHVLWVSPTEQPKKCQQIVGKIANTVVQDIINLQTMAEDTIAEENEKLKKAFNREAQENICEGVLVRLKETRREITKLRHHPKQDKVVGWVDDEIKTWEKKLLHMPTDA